MTELHLDLRATIGTEALRKLVRSEVERVLEERAAEPDPWLDVLQAARYYGYRDDLKRGRRRVYDLKAQGRLKYAKDGDRLLFRREWLDAALDSD